MGESSTPRRPIHDTNTSRRQVNTTTTTTTTKQLLPKQSKYKYTMEITGLIASTMLLLMASAPSGLLASPDGQPSVGPVEEIEYPVSDGLSTGIGLRQDVVSTRGRKLALIPLADIADIGLGVQKILNPTNGQVNSRDVRWLANTLQKYLPFPILSNGRQGTRGGGSSRKPTGGKPTGRTPTQGGGGEGEEGR